MSQLLRFGAEDVPDHLDDAVVFADGLVTQVQALRSRTSAAAEAVERTEKALEMRSEALAAAEKALQGWTSDWTDATASTWLGQQDRPVTPSEIAPVLAALQDLEKLLQRKSDLDHRIDGMRRDQAAFRTAVDTIAERLGIDAPEPLPAFMEIKARLSGLRENHALLKRLAGESDDKQAERRIVAEEKPE
ncbi:hypothetical protein P6U16_03160 [Rhizobium sp. 32-5/1]|uniref:hypothetical protein n=1 Tax=Rhizobium sp. 32-5/1 TaxID=3019602 RepID=UPI00240D5C16|nr:hypothetical protein [Rhizobium sp. 32-5/1]WEZ83798.1 hypothetical protein P6U16_03160 [Rhizobium sp. 32-5/1]